MCTPSQRPPCFFVPPPTPPLFVVIGALPSHGFLLFIRFIIALFSFPPPVFFSCSSRVNTSFLSETVWCPSMTPFVSPSLAEILTDEFHRIIAFLWHPCLVYLSRFLEAHESIRVWCPRKCALLEFAPANSRWSVQGGPKFRSCGFSRSRPSKWFIFVKKCVLNFRFSSWGEHVPSSPRSSTPEWKLKKFNYALPAPSVGCNSRMIQNLGSLRFHRVQNKLSNWIRLQDTAIWNW